MTDIGDIFTHQKRDSVDMSGAANTCVIANAASDPADRDLYVTFPNSDAPHLTEQIHYWQPGINLDGSVRLPEEGMQGLAIESDVGELWLIF